MDTTPQPERQNDTDIPAHVPDVFANPNIMEECTARWLRDLEHEAEAGKKWNLFVKEIMDNEP